MENIVRFMKGKKKGYIAYDANGKIILARNKEEAEVKIDIHDQVMLNFNRFVDYCWSFKEKL